MLKGKTCIFNDRGLSTQLASLERSRETKQCNERVIECKEGVGTRMRLSPSCDLDSFAFAPRLSSQSALPTAKKGLVD